MPKVFTVGPFTQMPNSNDFIFVPQLIANVKAGANTPLPALLPCKTTATFELQLNKMIINAIKKLEQLILSDINSRVFSMPLLNKTAIKLSRYVFGSTII